MGEPEAELQGERTSRAEDPHVSETAIRIGLLFVLAAWCVLIVRPFLVPILWGLIIAVGGYPTHQRLVQLMRGRRRTASTAFALLLFLAIIVPVAVLSGTMIEGAQDFLVRFQGGDVRVPPPPPSVAQWPLIGGWLHDDWLGASNNLEATLFGLAPHLKETGQWLLEGAASVGLGLLKFLAAVVIAAVLLNYGESAKSIALAIARRLADERGEEFAMLAEATVRSVTWGILGVAVLQAILAGLGFLAAGVPAAGLWALAVLVLSIVQVGVLPVMIPVLIYVYFHSPLGLTFVFFLWSGMVSVIDNLLKPILLSRGVAVPMWVVFLGAFGGLLSTGIIGLFIGPVVLVLGYKLFLAWLYQDQAPSLLAAAESPGQAGGQGRLAAAPLDGIAGPGSDGRGDADPIKANG